MASNGSLGAVYAGRFIAGLGIGQTPVVGPVYIAEIAPASIRGLCTCIFTGFVYLGIVLAYCTNYGANVNLDKTAPIRWLLPTSVHLMFATIILSLTMFQYESPRFLIKRGNREKATHVMSKLRNLPGDHPYVANEIQSIVDTHNHEMQETTGNGFVDILREAFCNKSNLYRVSLAIGAQIMSQWSGAPSITIYAPDLFATVGVAGTNQRLFITALFGVVKLIAAVICALFLVDFIGRKRSLLIGITLQAVAMAYVAGFLTAIPSLGQDNNHNYDLHGWEVDASKGAIAMIYVSGFGWALGWNSMQYLLTAELFPLRIRAFCTSLAMMFHFLNQFGNARTVPNMMLPTYKGGISAQGTFWFFFIMTVLGGFWVTVMVPETAGRDLESMDRLFSLPWYKIGLYGNKDAEAQDRVHEEKKIEEGTRFAANEATGGAGGAALGTIAMTEIGKSKGHHGGMRTTVKSVSGSSTSAGSDEKAGVTLVEHKREGGR